VLVSQFVTINALPDSIDYFVVSPTVEFFSYESWIWLCYYPSDAMGIIKNWSFSLLSIGVVLFISYISSYSFLDELTSPVDLKSL